MGKIYPILGILKSHTLSTPTFWVEYRNRAKSTQVCRGVLSSSPGDTLYPGLAESAYPTFGQGIWGRTQSQILGGVFEAILDLPRPWVASGYFTRVSSSIYSTLPALGFFHRKHAEERYKWGTWLLSCIPHISHFQSTPQHCCIEHKLGTRKDALQKLGMIYFVFVGVDSSIVILVRIWRWNCVVRWTTGLPTLMDRACSKKLHVVQFHSTSHYNSREYR